MGPDQMVERDKLGRANELIHYRLDWRTSGVRPGAHVGRMAGNGAIFRGHGLLIDHPDPRRVDLRATARDPYRRMLVKIFQQNAAIPVWVIADWSASMGFRGNINKAAQIAEISDQLAWSTWRMGDRLGFVACNERVNRDLFVPPRCSRRLGMEIRQRIASAPPPSGSAEGLNLAANAIGRERALVFLISDFHFSVASLKTILQSLSHHDVVPVVLWDQAEFADLPDWGLGRVRDSEGSQEQLLWFRPSLKRDIAASYERRRQELRSVCQNFGRAPFFVTGRFHASAMTRYFLEPLRCD